MARPSAKSSRPTAATCWHSRRTGSLFCPNSGRIVDINDFLPQHAAVAEPFVLDELVERLTQTTRLSEREARHLVGEILAFLDEPVERFARRRHGELQREGFS